MAADALRPGVVVEDVSPFRGVAAGEAGAELADRITRQGVFELLPQWVALRGRRGFDRIPNVDDQRGGHAILGEAFGDLVESLGDFRILDARHRRDRPLAFQQCRLRVPPRLFEFLGRVGRVRHDEQIASVGPQLRRLVGPR